MGVIAVAAGVVTGAGASPGSHPSAARASRSCPVYKIIDSRGSGSPLWTVSPPGNAFVAALRTLTGAAQISVVINPYPAVALTLADLHAPPSRGYTASVAEGQSDLASLLSQVQGSGCPRTKLILTGYSQGAQVVANVYESLATRTRARILAVILFGDPDFNYRDGTVDRGTYRAHDGVYGPRKPFVIPRGSAVLSYCNRYDPACQSVRLSEFVRYGFSQHENYPSEPYERTAATIVAGLHGP